MKITKRQLRRIIKEEKARLLKEGFIQNVEARLRDAIDEYVMVLDKEMGYNTSNDVLKTELLKIVDEYFGAMEHGLAGETYEKTAADYKKHPEWFN